MIDFVLQYGEIQSDKRILGRKAAQQLLADKQQEVKVLMKILDKGGVTVVADGNQVITTYNYKQYRRGSQ